MKSLLKENDSGIIDGLMMWVTVAIVLAILPTILFAVERSTVPIFNSTWNASQGAAASGVSSGFSILLIVLPVLAVVIIIGVLAILRGRAR